MPNTIHLIFTCCIAFLLAACSNGSDSTDANSSDAKISEAKTTHAAAGDIYERDYSPSFGQDEAAVTIVEFFDPACGACRAFYPFVKEILKRHPDDVRLVLRYAPFHQGSADIIRMLEAARQQNKYTELLEALLIDQSAWVENHVASLDKAWELAAKTGLDVEATKKAMVADKFTRILKQENEDIRALQIRQTPTFFVNKKGLEEFGAQQLYELVIAEIEASKK